MVWEDGLKQNMGLESWLELWNWANFWFACCHRGSVSSLYILHKYSTHLSITQLSPFASYYASYMLQYLHWSYVGAACEQWYQFTTKKTKHHSKAEIAEDVQHVMEEKVAAQEAQLTINQWLANLEAVFSCDTDLPMPHPLSLSWLEPVWLWGALALKWILLS